MEFFEKAHVSKRTPPKKDEMMKKQLKQMLHGYKRSDNELIKNSGNAYDDIVEVHRALDDSTSVSGFSDLDITKSDDEEELSQAVSSEACDDHVSSSSELSIINSLEQSGDTTDSQEAVNKVEQELDEQEVDAQSGDYLDPISEGDEDLESLPSLDTEASECSSTSGDISLLEFEASSSQVSSDVSDTEGFDPDGLLACKILKNMGKTSTENKKRKIEETPPIENTKKNKQKKKLREKSEKKNENQHVNIEIENLSINATDEVDSVEKLLDNNTQDSVSTNASSPFISITATEMSDQSLSEILGDYKHPTVRNLPCEKQNVIISGNNTSMFASDDNMQVEDVDSLIPEIGEDPTIEDIELDLEASTDSETLTNKENIDDSLSIPQTMEKSIEMDVASPVNVYFTNHSCIFVLQHPSEIYINGKVKIKPLGGTVEVFGHILKEEVSLYSPNNSFAQCLRTLETENTYYGLFGKLTAAGLSVSDAEEIVTTLGEYDGVISMSSLKDAKMEFVDNYFTADLFTKLKVDNKVSEKLGCSIYMSRPFRAFEQNVEWDEAVSCGLKRFSRGIICGGKGLGKSTFVRYYINRVLDNGPILVIELDPGQTEFTVAGNISASVISKPLLGPNFTHLKTPDICYNIGMINTMDNAFRYATTVTKLIDQCRAKYSSMPWIINTMGMTNQLGLKFLILAIIHAQPTFLVQIDSKVIKKRFESSLEPDAIRCFYESFRYDRLFRRSQLPDDLDYNFIITRHVEGSFKQDTSLSPKDDRYLNFLAYFGEIMDINNAHGLLGIVPYEVSLSDLNVATNVKVARDAVLKVINGKIVALCQLATADKGKVFTLQDNAPLCHGHGLVRGVDFENSLVYLVTPVAAERLSAVNTLVYSDWTPELQGTERDLPGGRAVPYRGAVHHKHKQHLLAPRRRFNPLQLLKMSRSA